MAKEPRHPGMPEHTVKTPKTVSIHVDAAGARALHVSGFSWSAALLQPVWALRHRLYGAAALMLAALWLRDSMVLRLPSGWLRELLAFSWFCVQIWFVGRNANRWHLRALQRRGFHPAAVETPPRG